MIARFFAWLFGRRRPAARTQVFCPGCGVDLVSSPVAKYFDTDLVRYTCGECFARSSWDFGPPVPILVEWSRD